ncbi:SGNH/GDSL hydrolase family protein [Asticcacaulis sp.]|uniref:SGNH/GDSL hydrolase family protein n=1 Tax=Asticcacaulis sp. TaxID=1872648 RepID=UPI0039E23C31
MSGFMLVMPGVVQADDSEQDWPNLSAYRQRDADLIAQAPVPHRVVFMGDSITEIWDRDHQTLFADPNHINRGISGQTTAQMLLRFRQDVIDLKPEVVVILGGTNDVAGNTGPATDDMIAGNIASMAELARAHGIRVVMVSILPTDHYWWAEDIHPAQRIVGLNSRLRAYAAQADIPFVDLYSLMVADGGAIHPKYSADGVHPNVAGYAVMNAPVLAAVRRAASGK